MVAVASSSATMDFTAVLPALMEGIAQEVGVDMNELKVILVGDETQLDMKPFQLLKEQYHQVEWDYKSLTSTDIPQHAVRDPKDGIVAGFTSSNPGRLWKFMTGHLQKLQSPISKSYFENIEYAKIPAFWSGILNPFQLQHALASVSEKSQLRSGSTGIDRVQITGTSLQSSTSSSTQPLSIFQSSFQKAQGVLSQSSVM